MMGDSMGAAASRRSRLRRRPGVEQASRRTLPFDYAFRFELHGEPGTTQQGKIEVSIESPFTAVSIGYGVVPEVHPVTFGIAPKKILDELDRRDAADVMYDAAPLRLLIAAMAETLEETPPAEVPDLESPRENLKFNAKAFSASATAGIVRPHGPRTALALRNGFRFNPEVAELLLQSERRIVPREVLERCFQLVAPPTERVQFKYALFDDGTGREFQNEPILNTAGLGAADGGRPFRYFATPIEFSPRSVIRMQITEVGDFRGELHISLQGYKVLGGAGSPTGRTRS